MGKPAFFDRPPVLLLGGDRCLSYLAEAQVPSSPTRERRDTTSFVSPADSTQSVVLFLFFTPMLIISGSTSQATQRPGPPGRATRRSITRLHWPAASAPLNATSNTTPRRPHRPSSLPHYHRSPFSLLLSRNRT